MGASRSAVTDHPNRSAETISSRLFRTRIALFLRGRAGVRFARRRTEHVGEAPRPEPERHPPPSQGTEKMTRDPILFRVDGTSRTGHERLYRCLTYAAA